MKKLCNSLSASICMAIAMLPWNASTVAYWHSFPTAVALGAATFFALSVLK